MRDEAVDPPKSFESAVGKFSKFLAENNYPSAVRWLLPEQVIPDGHRYWIHPGDAKAEETARRTYELGVERNLGIALRAVCADETQTFSTVFVPVDDADAQNNLMGRGLKLGCPVDKVEALTVPSRFRWAYLRLRYRGRVQYFLENCVANNCW